MKIYLFLPDKVMDFSLPLSISGSFSFDENEEEEYKLINVEADGLNWKLYSTQSVSIMNNGVSVNTLELAPDRYYVLKRKDTNYLIYATKSFDETFTTYVYNDDINLIIGNNDPNCNISFANSLIKGIACTIKKEGNDLVLNKSNLPIYVNDKVIKENRYVINTGDIINIYGLLINITGNLILMNNPISSVNVSLLSTKLRIYQAPVLNKPQDIDIKDVELYSKEDYYSKAPRLRRTIETKKISFSPPPRKEGEQELPLILTLGPTLTMGILSISRFASTIMNIVSGKATLGDSMFNLIQSGAMLLSALLWPLLTKHFNKKLKEKKEQETREKYTKYLQEKRIEIGNEEIVQREILNENLFPVEKCLEFIEQGKFNFWDKRIEQSDFLEVYMGNGDVPLDVEINLQEEGFSIDENQLRKDAERLIEETKYIRNVPVGYSFSKNKITALMGNNDQMYGMIHNIILELITFYSYEDLKIVVFTNDANKKEWDYLRYLNHTFSNDKTVRFFSSNYEYAKRISDYLGAEMQNRIDLLKENSSLFKPHYLIITDDYYQIKRLPFIRAFSEMDAGLGFSMIILENKMSMLPSKCSNFITLSKGISGILTNAFDDQQQISFHDGINYDIDMMKIAKKLSNIPIEFEQGSGGGLPESLTFLEMEKVGKVEQLNILNRWNQNDSTQSLKAEVGVDEEGNYMYLDLHEKYHGPHGLIAGMTGSGKSEFIITYILSMCMNYSPDDIAFILIDYKGGGLAGAFENKVTGVTLPHLAGTITNLDKAEMDRTLVSIDSEVKRRQKIFNEARDNLGESTIDIYKYQRFYKDGKIKEPCPHLFIICDEFAELKSQQPDFMDNLISVARIGRSLGVHLILATQKPSGVVNDQIWSNTKFRVCLKVQDASDSREMLKRPEAASLKQTGRFYLQVGYDEYFALGQSGWCGAKYYPSDKIIKQVDKSVNFIDDTGNSIKNIKAGNNIKIEAQGEQLAAILNSIIEVSKTTGKKAKRLWLTDIDPIILVDNLEQKYGVTKEDYNVEAIIGEYDAPEKQEQGLLTYSLKENGNTIIYGNDEVERENLVNAIFYSICKNYSSKEINLYAVDYGSESFRLFTKFPQVGGLVYVGEEEKFKNLFKLLEEEMKKRKKILVDYNGSLELYNSKNEEKIPQILVVFNNYEAILESYNDTSDRIISIARDCERYGISIIITCSNTSTIGRRLGQNFMNRYALHLTDSSDFYAVFGKKAHEPRETLGRGIVDNGVVHEFQTASIVGEDDDLNEFVSGVAEKVNGMNLGKAQQIPSLPEIVTMDMVAKDITTLQKVPVGISRETLKLVKYNFEEYPLTNILSNKLQNINSFMDSLLDVLLRMNNLNVFFFDTLSLLPSANKEYNGKKVYYFNDNFEETIKKVIEVQNNPQGTNAQFLYIFYGMDKLRTKIDTKCLEELFNLVKTNDNSRLIVAESAKGLKAFELELWYSKLKNNTDGLWVGSGITDQQCFRVSKTTKDMSKKYTNNYGYYLTDGMADLVKYIEFNNMLNEGDEDEE